MSRKQGWDVARRKRFIWPCTSARTRLLLDDGEGRREARRLGLQVTGVLGLLLAAKRIGLLPAVRPKVDMLRTSGFHVSEGLYQELLTSCGEI